jgi:TPR repeat protein
MRVNIFGLVTTVLISVANAAWADTAAEQGNESGPYVLGKMYETGTGVAQDFAKAVHWYNLSADLGNF